MALEKATAEITDSKPLTRADIDEIRTTLKVDTLLTNSTTITFERNSIHGTKDIPLSSGIFDLTNGVVGNVVQFWLNGSALPTDANLLWTNDTDQDFIAFERCLLTFNLHPDGVIVGTLTNI